MVSRFFISKTGGFRNQNFPQKHFIMNCYKSTLFVLSMIVLFAFSSCSRENYLFLKGDVIGFSEDAKTSYSAEKGLFKNLKEQSAPYDLTTKEGIDDIRYFIRNDVPRGTNTSAYYAMELACDRIKYVRKHVAGNDDNIKYYIFLLTDGLDNNSKQAALNAKQHIFPVKDYQKLLQKKLRKTMGWSKNIFEVYPMLYEGDDIKSIMSENNMDEKSYQQMLREQFECFRYSSTGEAPELIYADNFEEIFSELRKKFVSSSYEFRVPKSYVGHKIRMKFVSLEGKEAEMTGFLKKTLGSYSLEDIEVTGMNIDIINSKYATQSGKGIKASTRQDSSKSNIFFHIEGLELDGKAFIVGRGNEDVKQYYQNNGIWIVNSEYSTENYATLLSYFIIVIDGSKSLDGINNNGDGFVKEQKMALDIIDLLVPRNK